MPHTPNEPLPSHKKPNKHDKFYAKCNRKFRQALAREAKNLREAQNKKKGRQ